MENQPLMQPVKIKAVFLLKGKKKKQQVEEGQRKRNKGRHWLPCRQALAHRADRLLAARSLGKGRETHHTPWSALVPSTHLRSCLGHILAV